MASSSASALLASASNSNNATDSGLDDEDTSNESLTGTTDVILGFNNANASTQNHEHELVNDDIADEYSEDDHDGHNLVPPPAPPTSPTSATPHINHHLTLEDYSLLPEEDQHLSELQQFETNQPLIHRPFHMGRLDLDRIDAAAGTSGGDMEFSDLKLEEPTTTASPGPAHLFPGKFNHGLTSAMQQMQTNTNECKALIKFELPTSAQFLPKLVCGFQDHSWDASNYYSSLHVDTANHHCKQLQLHTFTEVSSGAGGSMCRALIPYEQRDLRKKDRVVFGYTMTSAVRDLKLSDESRNLSALTKRSSRRLRDNWNNLKKEHAENRLRSAANAGNLEIVKNILNSKLYDVNPNAADEMGRTALHMAAAKGSTDIVAALLEAGASPNRKDSLGNTPLHLAACTNHFSVVTRLLRAGTDISQLDNHGRNPLQLARAKLRILAQCKSNSSDLIRIKSEVQQIIEMMMEYLQKKGQDEEVELLNAFATRLTLQHVDEDVKSLLANLSNLSLMDGGKSEQRLQSSSPVQVQVQQSSHHHQSIT